MIYERNGVRCWANLVDEHPLAYKPVDVVMADQADLTIPMVTLTQIINYKGV